MSNGQVACSEDFSQTSGDPIPADWSAVTRGVFRGAAGAKVDLLGVDIRITEDLTIIADGDLTIDGNIEVAGRGGLAPFPLFSTSEPNINLISLNGSVIVTQGTQIGPLSESQPGADLVTGSGLVPAIGGDAADAGYIRISGVSLEIAGFVRGISGGAGGDAIEDRTGGTAALEALFEFLNILQSSRADGGRGGKGGDLVLCALEGITIAATGDVVGGFGGVGGFAKAVADKGAPATATGGRCGDAGNVIINGMQPGCQIRHEGDLAGGTGGRPVKPSAVAIGGTDAPVGGHATARGSDAGAGGTVIFNANCVLIGRGVVEAGDGPPGGDAEATGGNGGQLRAPPTSVFNGAGGSGGNATAHGGAGGAAGATPAVPLDPFFPPTTTNGRAGNNGAGGRATATPGNGGNAVATPAGMLRGGNSGAGEARGGPNGRGQGQATPVTTPASRPAAATPQTGALGTPAAQAGVP